MKRQDTATLALRLAALYGWIQAVGYFSGSAFLYLMQSKIAGQAPTFFDRLVFLLPGIAMLLVGCFLWWRARALAPRFLAGSVEESGARGGSAAALAFAIVGLALFLYALPTVVKEGINLVRSDRFQHGSSVQEFWQRFPSLAGDAVQLVCGFALFVRPHRLARWWEKKRDGRGPV